MSPARRSTGGAVLAGLLATIFGSLAGGAGAQPVRPPSNQTPPSPLDSAPPLSPFVGPPVEPVDSEAIPATAGEPIGRVIVASDDPGGGAVPPAGWVPPRDKSGQITLKHQPKQALDAAWAQLQFDLALASGPLQPSRAVALVQLINRAYISAGFINSGLLVKGREADALALELVLGRLAADEASAVALAVEFQDGRSRGLSADFIRARFPSTRATPLSAYELERDFRLLDEDPTVDSISAALSPGTQPGEASLRLVVNPAKRFDFYGGASNDRSPSVGGDRLFAGGYLRNLIRGGDEFDFEGGITRGVDDAQAGYSVPIFTPALSLSLRGSFNNAAVITSALAPLDIKARDRSAEIGLTYRVRAEPLMIRGGLGRWAPSEKLSVGLYWIGRRQKSYLLGEPFSFAPGSVDGRAEFGAIRLVGDYLRRDQRRVIALSLGAFLGLGGTRSDIEAVPTPHRHFAAVLGQLSFAQRIGDSFELRGRLTGQHSRGTLYSGLRLAVGGGTTVRGYRETLFLTDRGAIGSLELARNFSLGGNRSSGFDWGAFAASVFLDGAGFRNAEAPQPADRWIASVGAGLAWTPSPDFQASVHYGHALNRIAVPGDKSLQDHGIHFRIVTSPLSIFQ